MPDADEVRAVQHGAEQPIVALALEEMLVDDRLGPKRQAVHEHGRAGGERLEGRRRRSSSHADITAAPALVPPTTAPASIGAANDLVESRPGDLLHEAVLIAARHPDQRRALERGFSGADRRSPPCAPRRPRPRATSSPTNPRHRRARTTAAEPPPPPSSARQFQRPRHDRVSRAAAPDDDQRPARLHPCRHRDPQKHRQNQTCSSHVGNSRPRHWP